jgi:hypothetical protein
MTCLLQRVSSTAACLTNNEYISIAAPNCFKASIHVQKTILIMGQPLYQTIPPLSATNRGRMVANVPIPKGTLILEENPLVVIKTGVLNANWNANNASVWFNAERNNPTGLVHQALFTAPYNVNRHTFRTLSHATTSRNK